MCMNRYRDPYLLQITVTQTLRSAHVCVYLVCVCIYVCVCVCGICENMYACNECIGVATLPTTNHNDPDDEVSPRLCISCVCVYKYIYIHVHIYIYIYIMCVCGIFKNMYVCIALTTMRGPDDEIRLLAYVHT